MGRRLSGKAARAAGTASPVRKDREACDDPAPAGNADRSSQEVASPTLQKGELEALYQLAPIGLCLLDADLRVIQVSKHFAAMVGLAAGNHVGNAIDEAFPGIGESIKGLCRRSIETGAPVIGEEFRGPLPDRGGVEKFWSGSCLPVLTDGGRIGAVWVVVSDITAHRQTVHHLRVYQQIVAASPDNLSFVDLDYVYRAVSDAYLRAHNRPRGQIIGHSVAELLGQESFEKVVKPNFDDCLAGRQVRYQEWFTFPSLGKRFMDVVYNRFVDEDGKVGGVVVSARDITERRQMEEALRESQLRFQQITSTIEDVVWITEWDERRVLFANQAYEKMWGRPLERLYGNPTDWLEPIHPEDRPRVWQALGRLNESGRYDEEYRIVRPDGAVRWIRDRGYPVRDSEGRILQVVGIAHDITERKEAERTRRKLEAQLRHAQKLDAIGQLAAGVAHDVNSLLMVILGSTEIAQAILARKGRAEVEKAAAALEQIHAAVEKGKTIVQKLLAFGRVRTSNPSLIDLNKCVSETLQLVRGLFAPNIHIELSEAPDLRCFEADAGQMQQVVMNLLLNARDAMPQGGTLTIQTANVLLDEDYASAHTPAPRGPHVLLMVSDTGVGMNRETLDRAFEPFFTTKPVDKGSGLGLSIVYGIVEQTGGHVSVESEPGQGATFRLYFPVND